MHKRNKANSELRVDEDIPPEIRDLIKDRIVDLSNAHRWYRKRLEPVLEQVETEAEERDQDLVKLSRRFFPFFIDYLEDEASDYKIREYTPSDCVANALYWALMEFARSEFKNPSPFHEPLWPPSRPIAEAWQRFAPLDKPRGLKLGMTFEEEYPRSGTLPPLTGGQFQPSRIRIIMTTPRNKKKLPRLVMEIEGEPVCILIKALERRRRPAARGH